MSSSEKTDTNYPQKKKAFSLTSADDQGTLLGHDQHVTIRVVEALVAHGAVGGVDVHGKAAHALTAIAGAANGGDAVDEVDLLQGEEKKKKFPD